MEACREISPSPARACKIPTDAEEDCKMAVMPAPMSTPSKGLLMLVMASRNSCQSRRGSMAPDMVSMPTNRMPKPMSTSPKARAVGCFLGRMLSARPRQAKIIPKSSFTESIREGDRGADVGAHDDAHRLGQGQQPRVHKAHHHYRGGRGGLDHRP